MRKALVVGIDFYEYVSPLCGCVNDSYNVKQVLDRNSDGSINFDVHHMTASTPHDKITKTTLRQKIQELFSGDSSIALLYFAGHGHVETTGGYLITSDYRNEGDGLPLIDVMTWVNQSRAKNKLIILDSCFSGSVASGTDNSAFSTISEGTTILTASTAEQYASEENGSGVFTTLFVDALEGAAGNLVGEVSPGSIYAHIDKSLGAWQQRPVFKTNVKNFVSLRKVQSPIDLSELQQINTLFPSPGFQFPLDPSYEPERNGGEAPGTPPPNPQHTAIFKILQNYNRVNLVVPVDAPHMWHAAMQSKFCKLTVLGEHYRQLAVNGRI